MKHTVKLPKRVSVLVSGGGSNLQAIIDRMEDGSLPIEIVRVISNVPDVYALKRAADHHIPTKVISHKDYPDVNAFSTAILEELIKAETDIICLAGFLRILSPEVPMAFPQRILNIHPALLPAFGGKGMYGHFVHRAVLASGAQYSGATVHFVTEEPDAGPIIIQRTVPVLPDDDENTLAQRVLQVEHEIYPLALKKVVEEEIQINGLRVRFLD